MQAEFTLRVSVGENLVAGNQMFDIQLDRAFS